MRKPAIIYGAGGSGREAAWLLEESVVHPDGLRYEAACFVDDDPSRFGMCQNGLSIWTFAEALGRYADAPVVPAVGSPSGRRIVAEKIEAAGRPLLGLRHGSAIVAGTVRFGRGVVVAAGAIVTTNVELGDCVQVNVGSSISHDVRLDAYTTVSPGVRIAGNVHVGRGVFFGIGATVINGSRERPLLIGEDSVVGAGSCVVSDVPAGATVIGIPARKKGGLMP